MFKYHIKDKAFITLMAHFADAFEPLQNWTSMSDKSTNYTRWVHIPKLPSQVTPEQHERNLSEKLCSHEFKKDFLAFNTIAL